jgi:hypothetical protein
VTGIPFVRKERIFLAHEGPMTKNPIDLGCGPQPFGEQPSHGMPLERLTDLAAEAIAAITACEKAATPHYWRLGQILMLARKEVPRGDWAAYLTTLGIEKTRASKARAIYRSFKSLAETADLSVAEAYERRVRTPYTKKQSKPAADNANELPITTVSLPRWVYTLADDAARLRDEVEFLSATERGMVLDAVDRALEVLVELRAAMQAISGEAQSSIFPNVDPCSAVADDGDPRTGRCP